MILQVHTQNLKSCFSNSLKLEMAMTMAMTKAFLPNIGPTMSLAHVVYMPIHIKCTRHGTVCETLQFTNFLKCLVR